MFKSTTTSVKSFVARHKTAITITTTAAVTTAVCLMLTDGARKQHDNFLKEKGLFDEFYFQLDPEAM